jgi:predicted PurR-regulated permease PerM
MNNRLQNFVFGFALTLMVGWLLHIGRTIFVPITVSIFFAYILAALAARLGKLPGIGSRLPTSLRLLSAIAIVAFVLVALVGLVAQNVDQVLARLPEYQVTFLAMVGELTARLGLETEPAWDALRRQITERVDLQSLLGTAVASVSNILGNIFVVVIYTAFLLAERGRFAKKIRALGGAAAEQARIGDVIATINERVGDYLALKTLVNIILGAVSWLVMAAIGIDFAAFWAVWIGLANYVPYIGSFAGVAFPVALATVQFGTPLEIVAALIGLTLAQLLIGSVLEPRLMGRALNLSPFVILVALTTWYALWGVVGALFSVPITAIIMIALAEFPATRPIATLLSSGAELTPDPPGSAS